MDSLEDLADERDRLKVEERNIQSKLSDTAAKIAKLRDEIQNLRKNRDELNETVRSLKKTRDELRDSSKQNIVKLKDLAKSARGIDEGSRAEHEMAELEWKIQTSSLEKDEEKRVLNRVRYLETKVSAHRRTRKLSEDIGRFRGEADEIHAKIQELASKSQQYHLEVVSVGERLDALRLKFDEDKKTLDEVRLQAAEVGRKYTAAKTAAMQSDRVSQRKKEMAYKQNLKETAKKKLSESGKVSLEELGALMGEEDEK